MATVGEKSHGKVRPMLVRASDLGPMPSPDAATERSRSRGNDGRFLPGNPGGLGKGATAPIRRLLGGVEIEDADARTVARDAARIFADTLRELPNDGPTVRQHVALYARHVALSAFWSTRSSAVGLATPEGIEAADRAIKHDTRAERLATTMLAAAKSLASKPGEGGGPAPWEDGGK